MLETNGLELVLEVFDGWVKVPVYLPTYISRDGQWVPIKSGEEFIAVKGDSRFVVPRDSFVWEVAHGYTGWINFYFKENMPDEIMSDGEIYAVPKQWYEQDKDSAP
ncbi:MAG: hypothetical protein AABW49_04205 [Nanoarchaeota archaeon]